MANEINIVGNPSNITISSGDITPQTADGTDFGNVVVSSFASNSFDVENTGGPEDLNLTGAPIVNITGPNAADFAVFGPMPTTPIPQTSSSTFVVRFTPSAIGLRTATITILNDDSNEGTYTFAIQGTGISPEVNLSRSANTILNGGTDTVTGTTVGSAINLTYDIENLTGTAPLNLTGSPRVQISAQSGVTASVTAQPNTPVGIGSSESFTVQLTPSNYLWSFILSFSNDDQNEDPYSITVSGTATGNEIRLERIGVNILPPFPPVNINNGGVDTWTGSGGGQEAFYRLYNDGNQNLTITGTPTITPGPNCTVQTAILGTDVTLIGGSVILPSQFLDFAIRMANTNAGGYTAVISIPNNDFNESPFSWTDDRTTGGSAPIMDVRRGVTSIPPASTDTITGTTQFVQTTINYGVFNTGPGILSLTGIPAVQLSSISNATVTVASQPAVSIASNNNSPFSINVTPTAASWSFNVNITSNYVPAPTYTFTVSGTATIPEIEITRGPVIADGGTDIITGTYARIGKILNYVVNSVGSQNLVVGVFNIATATNCSAVVTTQPTGTILPLGSAALNILVTPDSAGAWSFAISGASDDFNENPYNWTVAGTATNFNPILDIDHNGYIIKVETVINTTTSTNMTNSAIITLLPNGIVAFNTTHGSFVGGTALGSNYQLSYKYSRAFKVAKNTIGGYDNHYVGDDVEIHWSIPVPININATVSLVDGANPSAAESSIISILSSDVFNSPLLAESSVNTSEIADIRAEIQSEDEEPTGALALGGVIIMTDIIDAIAQDTNVSSVNAMSMSRGTAQPSDVSVIILNKNEYPVIGNVNVVVYNA